MKFKVGDKVKETYHKSGEIGTIVIEGSLNDNGEQCWIVKGFSQGAKDKEGFSCFWEGYLDLIGKSKPKKVNFLLQYELEEDPVEEFETIVQVRKRIKELLLRDDLKEDSMVVYEIKSVKKVKISKSITIK